MSSFVSEFVDGADCCQSKSNCDKYQTKRGLKCVCPELFHEPSALAHQRRDRHHNGCTNQEDEEERTGVSPAFPEVHSFSFRTSSKKISRRLRGATCVTVAPFRAKSLA